MFQSVATILLQLAVTRVTRRKACKVRSATGYHSARRRSSPNVYLCYLTNYQ